VGSQGAQYDTPPVPLEESDEITLAGDLESIPELASADPTPPGPPGVPANMEPPAPKPQTTAPGPPGVPASVTPTAAKPQTSPQPPARASAAPPSVKPQPTSTPAETPAPTEPRKWNAAGDGREPGKARTVRPGIDPDHAGAASDKQHGKKPSTGDVAAPARSNPESPSVVVLPPQPTTPTGSPTPALRSSDTTATPHSPTTTQPADDPNLRPVLRRDMPISMVTPGRQPPVRSVPSAPGVSPIGPRRSPIAGPQSPPPMCDCTLRGTVEVQWDRPLTSRTEVVIAVEDAPDATTSAELFMGSPRSFEIRPAPCGVHRLLMWTRSRQRFVLVSSEPRVVCTPGGVQQMRLVLEPVARWGAAQ
jgi:hypothetical protein